MRGATIFRHRRSLPPRLTTRVFINALRWIDGTPLLDHVEPYRLRLFEQFFDECDERGHLKYNLGLFGRAKKNWKSADLVLACFFALLVDSPGGNQVYIVANDADQARDDLELAKKLRKANPLLSDHTTVKKNLMARRDGKGFLEVLAAGDAVGSHGKTYRLLGCDEVHGWKDWNLLEALTPDPTRRDSQQWITSYASIYHKKGVPLFDMMAAGKAGADRRMLFSWFGADFCTDPAFAELPAEQRANPSMASWNDHGEYLDQQRRRLPSHKFRRLHLNLPGLPEGSAFSAENIDAAIVRGTVVRAPERGVSYSAFVDLSGGSSDDAVLAIAHQDAGGRIVLDRVVNQGPPPPFDPRRAVLRFVSVLREYRISAVVGDAYAGLTFAFDFQNANIGYTVSERTKSELYEALEPRLNGQNIVLLDMQLLEQQLLGLVWRGGKIDHPNGEHDDWANAAAGALVVADQSSTVGPLDESIMAMNAAAPSLTAGTEAAFFGLSGSGDSLERDAFAGSGGSAFDLGKRGFGR